MAENIATVDETLKEVEIDLKDCLLKHMEISVTESEEINKSTLNFKDHYIVYLIETKILDNSWKLTPHGLGQLWRRYSEFDQLRRYLVNAYPWIIIPPLPEKKHSFPVHKIPIDSFNRDFIDRRRVGLENFLHRVASHPILSSDTYFLTFLQQEGAWKSLIKNVGYVQLAEDKLKALKVSVSSKDIDPEFDNIKMYSNRLQNCIASALKVRARSRTRIYNIYNLYSTYGKIFSEWSAIEKEMGDSLQKIGHYFDSIASNATTYLEEEEQLVDQLKEYYYYTYALDEVCSKRDILQLDLEQTQNILNTRYVEKDRVVRGKSSLISKLFGSADTEDPNFRQNKISEIDKKLVDDQNIVQQQSKNINTFRDKALNNYDLFIEQKDLDLTETLENFIKLQITASKKNLNMWTNIKECVDSIPTQEI